MLAKVRIFKKYSVIALVVTILTPEILFGWWEIWPYNDHQAITEKAIDIASERWSEMVEEINNYRDEMKQGSHDEDFGSDTLYGNSSDYSAYNPLVPQAYWPIARLHLNALEWIRAWQNPYSWDEAISLYSLNQSASYLALGHVLHNLQDLFVPAHSFVAPHGLGTGGLVYNHSWPLYFDNFEQYYEVTANELNRADPNRIPEVFSAPESLMKQAAIFATQDQESLNYFPNQYYAPPDSAGDWGKYRPYPYRGYPCGTDNVNNDIADAWSLFFVPRCVEYTAGMIRLFYIQFHTGIKNELKPIAISCQMITTNPCLWQVEINYFITGQAKVNLRIIDKMGRPIRTLDKGSKEPGQYQVTWDGKNSKGNGVANGIYFVVLIINNYALSQKIVKLY